jgi:hypothetical protein
MIFQKRKSVSFDRPAGFTQIATVWVMAKPKRKRPGRPKHAGPRRETVVALKGSTEWKSWLDGFSLHCRLGLSDTIEQSLICYAERRGYRGPPKR